MAAAGVACQPRALCGSGRACGSAANFSVRYRRWRAGLAPAFRTSGRATLFVFLHPRCSCSRATLDELERVLAARRSPEKLSVRVLFVREAADRDSSAPLWEQAQRLPGAILSWDGGGREAQACGAKTSGQVLFYDASGALRFAGGVTGSRGHAGDNYGAQDLAHALAGNFRQSSPFRVFGCALFGARI